MRPVNDLEREITWAISTCSLLVVSPRWSVKVMNPTNGRAMGNAARTRCKLLVKRDRLLVHVRSCQRPWSVV